MSDLLAIRDFDSDEFIDRIAGLYTHCRTNAARADALIATAERRAAGIRAYTFRGLGEIGQALLNVQDARPGEFEPWFELHQQRLGFSLRHARSCMAAARSIAEHGPEKAYELAQEKASRASAPAIRIPLEIGTIPEDRARELFEKIAPIYHALESRLSHPEAA